MRSKTAATALFLLVVLPVFAHTPAPITVTSPAFKHGAALPVDYTADGKNISSPLMWSNLPAGTKEMP